VTQVLSAGDEFDGRKKGRDDDDAVFARTEVLQPRNRDTDEETGEFPGVGKDADDDFSLDIDLDELSAALDGGDTVEQPSVGYGNRRKGGIDLDIGFNPLGSDDPTATEQVTPLDAQTLTEVGTKLDLARAYIDMGDPEGARSILEEVIDEGDSSQQREARGLIEAL
jgi:pilus assembly protein FimV